MEASNLLIVALLQNPNPDGIHISHHQDIKCDDHLSIVSGSRNIGVRK
ncbi:hypothetical protein CASFOL_001530 [Castilleja foliolosa]|uniref:Uncharacterized protein n=1 Tax=Castilleja foliolosa TaxID=1961234 RepID=A0ABD3EJT6_9LAMI